MNPFVLVFIIPTTVILTVIVMVVIFKNSK